MGFPTKYLLITGSCHFGLRNIIAEFCCSYILASHPDSSKIPITHIIPE